MKQKCDRLAEKETTIGTLNRLLFAYFILFGTLAAGDIKAKIEEKIDKIYKKKGPVFEAKVYKNYNKVKKLKK